MARMVQCVKLKREAEGLDYPPYPGDLGVRIWQSVSKDAWAQWMDTQTRLVNENRLNLADARMHEMVPRDGRRYAVHPEAPMVLRYLFY